MAAEGEGGNAGRRARVSIGSLELKEFTPEAELRERNLIPRIGRELALYLLGLVAFVVLLISLYAWLSYPTIAELQTIVPQAQLYESYSELRNAWFLEVKGLLELLVVSLLVPLFATVMGYIFGRSGSSAGGDRG